MVENFCLLCYKDYSDYCNLLTILLLKLSQGNVNLYSTWNINWENRKLYLPYFSHNSTHKFSSDLF